MTWEAFFLHAEELIARPRDGRPREIDLRRAVSAAYYGLFHTILADCAFEHAPAGSLRFDLIYRSVDHSRIEKICRHVANPNAKGSWAKAAPPGGFDEKLREAASIFIQLKADRHEADYSPTLKLTLDQARDRVRAARAARAAFKAAPDDHRKLFLTLLLCDPRG